MILDEFSFWCAFANGISPVSCGQPGPAGPVGPAGPAVPGRPPGPPGKEGLLVRKASPLQRL